MHENTDFHWMSNEFQYTIHHIGSLFLLLTQNNLTPFRMDNISKHSSSEVKTEHMYLGLERTLHKFKHPFYNMVLHISPNQILFNRTFLKNSQAESLRNIAILLLF